MRNVGFVCLGNMGRQWRPAWCAPISGGVPPAKTGELAIMTGGDAAVIDQVMPLLSAMGSNVLRTGTVRFLTDVPNVATGTNDSTQKRFTH